jgi:two-component system KDP operon response regulator KdpE
VRMPPKRILVVDDEPAVLRALGVALDAQGYATVASLRGEDAVAKAAATPIDLILLDLGLPGIDGFEVIRRVRAFLPAVPIVVVSAQGDEEAKVEALDLGADDYVEKPFAMPELLARVRVALRHAERARGASEEASRLVRGPIEIDLPRRRVTVRGEQVDLTPTQFDLLVAFARHPGRVLTHRAIVAEVWGDPGAAGAESLRVHVSALRQKIEEVPRRPRLIVTDPGVGYRFLPGEGAFARL